VARGGVRDVEDDTAIAHVRLGDVGAARAGIDHHVRSQTAVGHPLCIARNRYGRRGRTVLDMRRAECCGALLHVLPVFLLRGVWRSR
jgi:hypothetical protein